MKKYLDIITKQLLKLLGIVKRYQVVIFIIFLAVVFGFLIYRINVLSSQQPTDSEISSQVSGSKNLHLDQSVVNKIQTLQDNSDQVKTLFNNARNNPFAE